MKIKLDENLPASLVASLSALGHEMDSVTSEGLSGRRDPEIWQAAQEAGRFFITQDLDFSDLRKFRPCAHEGLMLVRLRLPGRERLARSLLEAFRTENAADWRRCFVVLTDRMIRVRRPGH